MFSSELTVTIPHKLTQEQAAERISKGLDALREKYKGKYSSFESQWSGMRLDSKVAALGQNVTSVIDIEPAAVVVRVKVPLMLIMLKGKIEELARKNGERLLRVA